MSASINGIGQVRNGLPLGGAAGGVAPSKLGGSPDGSFKDTFAKALGDVQGMQDDAGDAVGAFLRGDPVELHDVMAAVEEAGIALEMLIEVRNRFIEAYRTVSNMQT